MMNPNQGLFLLQNSGIIPANHFDQENNFEGDAYERDDMYNRGLSQNLRDGMNVPHGPGNRDPPFNKPDHDRFRNRDRDRDRRDRHRARNRHDESNRDRSRSRYDNRRENNGEDMEGGHVADGNYEDKQYNDMGGDNEQYEGGYNEQRGNNYDASPRSGNDRGGYASQEQDNYRSNRDRGDRDRNRNRDRDRDRDRDRYRRDGSPRDRDHGRDRHRDGSYSSRSNYPDDIPTNTIIVRGLPADYEERDLRIDVVKSTSLVIKDIRLVKRNTGGSRRFAFVEFHSVENAQEWMEQNQGMLKLANDYTASMHYSTPRRPNPHGGIGAEGGDMAGDWVRLDWICKKCSAHNFKKRNFCFKCSLSRADSESLLSSGGNDQVGSNPCNTLLFRGLDALTTEETLSTAIVRDSGITPKNIRIIRDQATGLSKCFAFTEMSSIKESNQFLQVVVTKPPFEVDGKGLLVTYAKNTYSTVMATLNSSSAGYQGSETQAAYYYDEATGQYRDSYTHKPYDYNNSDTNTNAAAAVAQAAIQMTQRAKGQSTQSEGSESSSDASAVQQPTIAAEHVPDGSGSYSYPVPDVSTYQYDATSGYYYDASTGLYYDSNSTYYYNNHLGKFLYWDGERQTYLLEPNSQAEGADGEKTTDKKKEKKEKVKVAKKIAKDMEKWAKSMNAKNEALKDSKKVLTAGTADRESASADAGFNVLERKSATSHEETKLMPPPSVGMESVGRAGGGPHIGSAGGGGGAAVTDTSGLVASYGGDSDSEDDEERRLAASGGIDESKLVDLSKMACLLCKRRFPSREVLQKHLTMSDLHKKNMEELRKNKLGDSATQQTLQYRDRAKERRKKYGAPDPPIAKRMERPAPELTLPPEQPTRDGIGQDNIGSKLLQKMGWSHGTGLGREGQGRIDPVEAKRRQMSAGLGAAGSNVQIEPGDTYQATAKKVMFARYADME